MLPAADHSHVALSQCSVDRQQAGDLLDDDLPSQLDRSAAGVAPLTLGLEPPGFLADRRAKERRGDGSAPQRRNQAPLD